jgi:hypothetical protein
MTGTRSSLPHRAAHGALVALLAVVLGASSTADAHRTATAATAGTAATARQHEPGDGAGWRPLTHRQAGASGEALATAPATAAATNLSYNTVTPCRAFDSRTSSGRVGQGQTYIGYSLQLRGGCGIPNSAAVKAVAANIIVVDTVGSGYVRQAAYPIESNGQATVLNFNNTLLASNQSPLPICEPAVATCTWDVDFYVNAGSANIVFDVFGYYSSG